MKNKGFVPGFATSAHRDTDAFFSCSENEDDDTEQGPSTQSRHVLIPISHPIPSHRVYSRWWAFSKPQKGLWGPLNPPSVKALCGGVGRTSSPWPCWPGKPGSRELKAGCNLLLGGRKGNYFLPGNTLLRLFPSPLVKIKETRSTSCAEELPFLPSLPLLLLLSLPKAKSHWQEESISK